jgi:translocation and assembly module TamB
VETVGKLTDAGPELTADIVEFGGDLRGYPVRLGADLAMSGETIRLTELTAGSGATELDAEGVIDGEKLDLRFDFDSPDLATLIPGGGGSLAADGWSPAASPHRASRRGCARATPR